MCFSERCLYWHSPSGSMFPGPGGRVQSCGMQQAWVWLEGSVQPAGSSAVMSQNPCQELTGPIREEPGPHPCMLISSSEEPGLGASVGGSLLWIQQQSHNITWAGKPSGMNVVSWHWLHEAPWPSITSSLLGSVDSCRVKSPMRLAFSEFCWFMEKTNLIFHTSISQKRRAPCLKPKNKQNENRD